jgi:methyltransferase (TIGR00027 family)
MRRAAHQLLDTPRIFDDPLAARIVGLHHPDDEFLKREDTRLGRVMRAFMAARSRYAEDALAAACERGGVRQYVVLGAGLDTFAYRSPYGDAVRVFEVDYPATQQWKRARLAEASIAIPPTVTYVPVDFDRANAFAALGDAGFDAGAPAFFAWLGVTMYLAEATVMDVLRQIASLTAGSGVAFDYAVAPSLLGPIARRVFEAFAERVAAVGEPWTTFFTPEALDTALGRLGFGDVEDLDGDAINARYFANRSDGLRVGSLARLARATT